MGADLVPKNDLDMGGWSQPARRKTKLASRQSVRANAAWRLEALLGHRTQHRFGLFTSCPPLAYSLLTLLPLCTLGVRSRKTLAGGEATGRVSAGLIGGPTLCWCLEHVSCTLAWTILCVR